MSDVLCYVRIFVVRFIDVTNINLEEMIKLEYNKIK